MEAFVSSVLVTGASGMLGADIAHTFDAIGRKTIKACHHQRSGEYVSADLTSPHGIKSLAALKWDVVVHSAAWREPDKCQKDREAAFKVNSESTAALASEARRRGAFFIQISTDYVFPGTNPPYPEDAAPAPINIYGESKLAAERVVADICGEGGYAILRIPILYGAALGIDRSPLIASAIKAVNAKDAWMEDVVVRYPTYTGDVAAAVLFLAELSASGVFHFSGQDKTTKYGIAMTVARIIGKDAGHIRRVTELPPSEAPRPMDAHLGMRRLSDLGFPAPMAFHGRLARLLERP